MLISDEISTTFLKSARYSEILITYKLAPVQLVRESSADFRLKSARSADFRRVQLVPDGADRGSMLEEM